MFRQTLDSDSMYADAAIHGSGETALQYRRNKGDTTQDIAFNIGAPQRLRLEKRGDTITLFLSAHGEPLHQVGASIKLHFDGEFYAGPRSLRAQQNEMEQATFAHVDSSRSTLQPSATMALYSTLQTIAIDNNARMAYVIQTGKGQMEAPNWSRDGKTLIFDRAGKLWSVPAAKARAASPRPRQSMSATRRLHGQPRPLARWQMARHHLHHAGPARPPRLHRASHGRHTARGHQESQLLFP